MDNRIIYKDAARICERVFLQSLQDKTILISGASGLIGTYFLACLYHLKSIGYRFKVHCQIFSDPTNHILDLAEKGEFSILRPNLANFDDYKLLPKTDLTIHAAGYAQPIRFMENPVATLQINTSATLALLQRLRPGGHFLFLSSSEVYTGLQSSLFTETDLGTTTPYHPRASYIEGKRGGEAACYAFRSQGVNATSVRLGDVYGPGTRKHDKRAWSSFIEQAICNHKIELLDAGTAIRTYCYVADAVELMWQILLHGKEAVYNVGGRSAVTITELAQMIGQMTKVPVVVPSTSAHVAGAPLKLRLDLTRIDAEFGKSDYIGLEEGLKRTIDWQRGLYLQ